MDYFVEQELPPTTPSRRHDKLREQTASPTWTLAARLNLLFSLAADNEGAPPTNAQVATATTAAGAALSTDTLAAARAGVETELPVQTLSAIADYFRIPSAVLTDDGVAQLIAEQLPAARLLRDDAVRKSPVAQTPCPVRTVP